MTPPRYRTDYHLWLVVAVCLFVALGFFDPSGGYGKGNSSLWGIVAVLVTYFDRINVSEMLAPIALYSGMLAAAALVGWAVQAVVVVIRSRRTAVGRA